VRYRIRFSGWVPLTCLLFLPACSGEESFALPPVPVGTPSTRYEAACTTWARSDCSWRALCGLPFPWDNGEQCVARETLTCELMAADPGVSFDEERIRNCQLPSDCSTPPPVCWPQGHTPLGQRCLWGEACHSGFCVGVGSGRLGVCGLCVCDIQCPPGQGCLADSSGGRCVSLPREPGASCSSGDECQSKECVPSRAGPLVCAPFGQLNDPCGEGSPACGPDVPCDDTGHCSATEQVGYGARCGPQDDGGAQLACKGSLSCIAGACPVLADDGQPCDPDHVCLAPAMCIANLCVFATLGDCAL
jgi:hypothetical protein